MKTKNVKGDNEPIGIIYCDSDMFTNKILKYGNSIGNLLLFENSINFLVDDFKLLNIPGKDLDTKMVTLSAKAQKYISLTLFIFIEVLALLIIFGLRFYKNYMQKIEIRKEVKDEKIE